MPSSSKRTVSTVAVIGAGIKGAAVAGLLSQQQAVRTTVYESSLPASGASSRNHGRLHSGAAGWRTDSTELLERRRRGSELWRSFGVGRSSPPALYGFAGGSDLETFTARMATAGIATRPVVSPPEGPLFSGARDFIEVPEFGFSPPQTISKLLGQAVAMGAEVRTGDPVLKVAGRADGGFDVVSAKGQDHYDWVVVCAGRWSSDIQLEWRSLPLFDLQWFEWTILSGRQPATKVSRVLVNADDEQLDQSVVPHGEYLTFDMKAVQVREVPTTATSVDADRVSVLARPMADPMYRAALRAFSFLEEVRPVTSFVGIQPRLSGAQPGSMNEVRIDAAHDQLLVTQGGQASTALLDAIDVCHVLWTRGGIDIDPYSALGALHRSNDLRMEVRPMAWETAP